MKITSHKNTTCHDSSASDEFDQSVLSQGPNGDRPSRCLDEHWAKADASKN